MPSIAAMPREESFALAFFGTMRKAQESAFALSAGRKSFALKRIVVLVICTVFAERNLRHCGRIDSRLFFASLPGSRIRFPTLGYLVHVHFLLALWRRSSIKMPCIRPLMTSIRYWARIGWVFLHLVLVALVCIHETAWLVGKQLTILPGVSSLFWKEVDNVPGSLIGANLPVDNIFRQVLNTYTNIAGIEVGYGYFAPNISATHALVFELSYPDGHLEYEPPLVGSHEGELRLTSLIEQIGRTESDSWRNELIRRLARSTWQQHPAAVSIRGFFGSVTPPTLGAYKSGKNERVFTCEYVYDFTLALRKEGGTR